MTVFEDVFEDAVVQKNRSKTTNADEEDGNSRSSGL